jgi:CubicO group peptidase (beta-lactamase class C family)
MSGNRFIGLLTSAIVLSCSAQPASSQDSLTTLEGRIVSVVEFEASVSKILEKAGVAGLSCAVINDSAIVYVKAFGHRDVSTGALNDEETNFAAASFSKTVFAYLVMSLVEERALDLDEPLQVYLGGPLHEHPAYADLEGDERSGQITARMVLSHTTGFPNWRFLTEDGRLGIMFEPGSRFSYSGEGFGLLQKVVERVTGQGLEELAQTRVFAPLGMMRTSYVWQEMYESNFAAPHDEFMRPRRINRRREADAAGSLQTTAADYARVLVAILNAEGTRKASVDAMLEPQIAIQSQRMFGPAARDDTGGYADIHLAWSLGWGRFDSEYGRAFFHTGHDFGFQNYNVTYPDKGIGVMLLSNSDNFESVAREIVAAALGDDRSPFDWLGYPRFDPSRRREPPPEPVAIEVDPSILSAYTGEYRYATGELLFFKLEGDRLLFSQDGETWDEAFPETETRFFIEGDDLRFEFQQNGEGEVTGLVLQVQGLELRWEKMR